jgi:hypothetical protein
MSEGRKEIQRIPQGPVEGEHRMAGVARFQLRDDEMLSRHKLYLCGPLKDP